ncbi:uncharacterized protein LOC116429879 [Nomia melanderi]|uniref:uncharacterized protein LOC116429879 n=1 Tax=Nomia melanderi TaxID=2448451 RepID=UPI0013042415|nr:uncharacterized protein LOC116429879 [Nomia melanderi]
MALSTELLKRLNSDEEPLPKRLKLAENTFCTVDIPIVRKEDLILQWLCETCSTDENSWRCIRNCLKTKNLDIKNDVKKLLVNTLIARLQGTLDNGHSDIFECYELLVSNHGMQQYFLNEPKDLGVLIKTFLIYALKFFKCTFNIEGQSYNEINIELIKKDNGLPLIIYNRIINIIESMVQIFKLSFTAKDELKTMFVHDILYPLCDVIDHRCIDNTNRLGAVTYKCIQQLMFGKNYVHNATVLKNKNITQFIDLISALGENAQSKDLQSNLRTFSFVFRAAVGVFKSDSATVDLILRELVKSAGTEKKEILSTLLKHLNDITFNFENKIQDVTLFDYCQNIIDNILLSEDMSTIEYVLLSQFCSFNPLLIEKKIQEILRKAFQGNPTLEYTNLLISILTAVVYLRQEEKLISSILITLKQSNHVIPNTNLNMFFPCEFKEKFMKMVNNISTSQSVSMLRTLIYHLKTDCMEVLKSNDSCKNLAIMHATIDLLIMLLNGICIFDQTGALSSHQKFVNAFNDLGSVLSLLVDRILYLNHNKKIIVMLLDAIFSWNETKNTLKYYVPRTVMQNLKFPILQDQWQQLIPRITNFGRDSCKSSMNKLILQQIKISRNTSNKSFIELSSLIGGLKCSWKSVLKFDTDVIPFLTTEEILTVTNLLLIDIISNEDKFSEWMEILHKDSLQEDKRFMMCLLSSIVMQIENLITEGITKSICQHFTIKPLLENEDVENQKINEMIMLLKEDLLKDKWVEIENALSCQIVVYLKVLLHIPLIFLKANIKLIIFIIIFALKKECDQNYDIISLCNIILSDLLEKPGLDIFQYINPSLLLHQLPLNKNVQKSLELSLRNDLSYIILKKLINASMHSKKNLQFLLESLEHVKQKLSIDQKAIIKKGEKKLNKVLIKMLPSVITEADDVAILNLILRISVSDENINEELNNLTQQTLQNIFLNDCTGSEKNEVVQEALKLAVAVLHNRKIFKIEDQTIKGIWCILFKNPCENVLLPFLESSESIELEKFLEHLHNQMIRAITDVQENDLENVCIIWNSILKTNMSNDRNKLRLTAINKSIQMIQVLNIPNKLWSNLLKFTQNILSTKHLYLPDTTIDMSIFLGLKSLQEATIVACNNVLTLCNILLKMRTSSITDRLPSLLALYRSTLNVVVHKSKGIVDKSEEHIFKCIALDIEKFTSSLIKLKKDMARLSPYVIADLLNLSTEPSIATSVKIAVQNCIYLLISICDQHGIALLSRTLPISMQEIFKTQLDIFNKFYKFSGKI